MAVRKKPAKRKAKKPAAKKTTAKKAAPRKKPESKFQKALRKVRELEEQAEGIRTERRRSNDPWKAEDCGKRLRALQPDIAAAKEVVEKVRPKS